MSVGGKISGKQYTGNYGTHSYRKNVGKLYTVKVGIQFTGKSSVDCTPKIPVWTHTGKRCSLDLFLILKALLTQPIFGGIR